MKSHRFLALIGAALLLGACAASPAPQQGPTVARVHVVSVDWHTSIVVAGADLPAGRIPEAADFSAARFIEFGWGDAEFYQAEHPGIATTLRAGLWPTPSVLHVNGFDDPPAAHYPGAKIEEVPFDAAGFAGLVDFIHESFQRGDAARVPAIGPGLTPNSRFYPARRNFHILYTCNTWTARALKDGGLDIDVGTAKIANSLIDQIRRARWRAEGWK